MSTDQNGSRASRGQRLVRVFLDLHPRWWQRADLWGAVGLILIWLVRR